MQPITLQLANLLAEAYAMPELPKLPDGHKHLAPGERWHTATALEVTGIAKGFLKTATVLIEYLRGGDEFKRLIFVRLDYRYTHFDGGSNGKTVDLVVTLTPDGKKWLSYSHRRDFDYDTWKNALQEKS